jgi:hypothetical protein
MPVITQKVDPLLQPAERLRIILEDAASQDQCAWLDSLNGALSDFWQALNAHECASEAPNGTLTTLDSPEQDMVPKLNRRVQQLRSEHGQMLDNARELNASVENITVRIRAGDRTPELDNAIAGFRQSARKMVDRALNHRKFENELLLDAITTDIGAGD